MIEVFPVTLPRLSGKQSRRVYVYVPDALAADPDARYPVLYMFDGHNVFFDQDATYGKSWGMKEYMDQTQTPLTMPAFPSILPSRFRKKSWDASVAGANGPWNGWFRNSSP